MKRRPGRAIVAGLAIVGGLAPLACLVAIVGPASAIDTPSATPPLAAVADTYDAGRVPVGVPVTHTYELRNTGSTALQIHVQATCGCTSTDYDKFVPPSGTGKVTAVLDTTHVRGRVSKTLHITTNDTAQPPLTLTMIAETIRLLDVLPSETPVLRAPVGALKPLVLTVTAPDGNPFAIVRVEDDPDLRARVDPADPPAKDGHRRYHVTLTPKPDLAVGTYTPTITLVTTLATVQRFPLQTTIVVSGPLTTLPSQLRVRSATTPMHVRITKAGATPFTVVAAEPSDHDFTATATAAEDGHAWDVTLRYAGAADRHGP
ncbi:MAG: DUF1573 domain-containing protein [Candidatus Binatia bacterium]